MRITLIAFLLTVLFASSSVDAQQWTDVTLATPSGFSTSPFEGQPASPLNPLVEVKGCDAGGTVCATSGISLQSFASTSYVNGQFSGLNTQLGTANGNIVSINSQIAGINTHLTSLDSQVATMNALNAQISKIGAQVQTANQLAAVAAAMKDAIPSAGDRYAVRVNMASWNSEAAGSVSFSANVDDALRLSVNYGRSRQQNMFSGGFNFSFN